MSAEPVTTTRAVRPDIAVLRDARHALKRLSEGYSSAAYQSDEPGSVRHAAYAEAACDRAEDALFGVLNTLDAYLDDEDAKAVLHDRG